MELEAVGSSPRSSPRAQVTLGTAFSSATKILAQTGLLRSLLPIHPLTLLCTRQPNTGPEHNRAVHAQHMREKACASTDRGLVCNREVKGKSLCIRSRMEGFPGGAVVKNPPANAGDTGSSPGPGRSHRPRSN